MLGILFFIALSVIILAGIIFYINKRNNENDNFLISELKNLREVKNKVVNHLTNSLTEVDYLNMKYKYLGTSNSDSVCYKNKDSKVDNCECHPSCETCGYSDNPIGMNQCLKCKNGTEVNKLYSNGAGWCSSYQLDQNTEQKQENTEQKQQNSNEESKTSSSAQNQEDTSRESEAKEKITQCLNKFKIMCPSSSTWKECLETNKESLVLSGCQISLQEDGSVSANYSPVTNNNDGSTPPPDSKEQPSATKYQLKQGEVLKQGEHLLSTNSRFYLRIDKTGALQLVNNQTTAKTNIFKLTPPSERLGPYSLKFRMSNKIVFANKDGEILWSVEPKNIIEGPNSNLYLSDTGILIFKDNNENIRWTSKRGHSSDGSNKTNDSNDSGDSGDKKEEKKEPTQYTFPDPIFGVLKFSKCPKEYPYKANTVIGTGLACSKEENANVNRENSCAVKGFRTGSGAALLPRCFTEQVGLDPNTGKYVKCPDEPDYPGAPQLNRYVMWQGRRSKKIKCKKRKDNTNKYRRGPDPIVLPNFQDI